MEHLTKDELRSVLTIAKAASQRDYVLFLTAYCHGLRISEACGLMADNVRDGYLDVQRLKGSLHTVQPLVMSDDPLLNERAVLTEYVAGKAGRLFAIGRVQAFKLFQRYAALAGIPAHKRHCHVLKHSVAMHQIGRAGIENVRQYLGHKSISSTGAYLKVSDEAAAAAMSF